MEGKFKRLFILVNNIVRDHVVGELEKWLEEFL